MHGTNGRGGRSKANAAGCSCPLRSSRRSIACWITGSAGRPAAFYADITDGHYLVADLPHAVYARLAELNRQYADLELGFVDAAIVALAEHLEITRVATTDRRHFEPLATALELELVP